MLTDKETDVTPKDPAATVASGSGARVAATATVAVPAGLHGVVSPYDGNQEEWVEYAERLENYFIANDIEDVAKRRAILLNGVGASTYRLIKTLAFPGTRTPKELTFEQIVERVRNHFDPKPSPIIKRYEFNTRKQKEGETVAEYVAALRKLAEYCEYPVAILNDLLRDRLVCGIYDKRVQQRFLQEAKLPYDKALSKALAAETAVKDSKRLQESAQNVEKPPLEPVNEKPAIHRVGRSTRSPNKRTTQSKPPADGDCYRCGGKHQASKCKFKDYECHFCKKKGHLASVCRKKQAQNKTKPREQTNRIDEESSADDDDDQEYALYRVSSGSSKPILVPVTLDGVHMEMELDTGASVSLVSEETFRQLQEKGATLSPSQAKLCTYTGQAIEIAGLAEVRVEHNDQSTTLPLFVTQGKGPSLLGRNWLDTLRLNWKKIFMVQNENTLQDVLGRYPDVFQEELGTVKGVTAKIHVDPTATPKFCKARSVPFALQAGVEEELERLQKQGIIEPIQFSDWAAPIVPVVKSDGKIRICGDYKVTINQSAKIDKYPIPRIDDLFASLSGGKRFSKLDLSHAYQQLKLDDESRQYVTINTHKGLFTYNRLPFGVSSAPSIFQRVMENLLQGIPGVCVYIDDILVTGRTDAEHLDHLAQVLQRLQDAGMRLKRAKCSFLLPSVEYLGHVICAEGLCTSDAKVGAIVNAPAPRNVTELRSFLGLVNYYGKFLPDLATTLSPLYQLLQKRKKWTWDNSQEKAFEEVKKLLLSSRVLVHFDDKLPLILSCDASPYGVGAVLSHRMATGDERPICFASRTLTAAECKYSQLDKEALMRNGVWCQKASSILVWKTIRVEDRSQTAHTHLQRVKGNPDNGIWKNPTMGINTRCIQLHNSVSERRRELQCGCTEQIASGKPHKRPTQASRNDPFDGIPGHIACNECTNSSMDRTRPNSLQGQRDDSHWMACRYH